jgi:glutamate synthase (NADPH/NADH) small chain
VSVGNPLRPRDRVAIPRQRASEADPERRARCFDEVTGTLDPESARREALRCLDCRNPPCVAGCPVGVDVPGFIRRLLEDDLGGALGAIRMSNPLPAVCGRVCPQESQCERVCTLARKFEPLAIGALERYVADRCPEPSLVERPATAAAAASVAVVGSGPAGIACAADLARLGYRVTVLEALHAPGGVLRYGIPEFRLPRGILDGELAALSALGVQIRTNVVVGRTVTVDELLEEEGFAAIFLATGAGTPTFLGIPGEGLCGVLSANELLTRVNLMGAHRFPRSHTPLRPCRSVAVVGGGNTALDAARTALRIGAERVTLVYRRSQAEMPARAEELRHAIEEGVAIRDRCAPVAILGDDRGDVVGLEVAPTRPGAGRSLVVDDTSREVLDVDTVVIAVGQRPNPVLQATTPGLAASERGTVTVDGEQRTSRPLVFAGGDLSRGGATVILAMKDGRAAAAAVHEALAGRPSVLGASQPPVRRADRS